MTLEAELQQATRDAVNRLRAECDAPRAAVLRAYERAGGDEAKAKAILHGWSRNLAWQATCQEITRIYNRLATPELRRRLGPEEFRLLVQMLRQVRALDDDRGG